MSTLITPTLLRRYLKATGWTRDNGAWTSVCADGSVANCIDGSAVDRGLAIIAHREGSTYAELCARLGMLAVADSLFARAAKIESSSFAPLSHSWDAAKKRLEDLREAKTHRDDAERAVEQAGVDPTAWAASP
jgi:hypothetical protein